MEAAGRGLGSFRGKWKRSGRLGTRTL
ncbi:unnamed protein product [Linum tenue]|uniref:Uncharacterized protein n=1 Tax=Linum tenue TaxID=586396 RepID=A0AAV0MYS3_9ROSI|nr:unnamed protein product [Linum tenue]